MPKVSVIILNWNGKRFLDTCLTSLAKVTSIPLEVILVDNNSSDGSAEYVRKKFPNVTLIASRENNGFAKGNNIGAAKATGKYLLFLNNDTKVTPDFLIPMVEACEKDKTIGCIQPEMRVMKTPNLLDEAGAYLTFTGLLYHYGYRKNHSMAVYKNTREIFSAKGACIFIPKSVFRTAGEFDESFFIFFEETDLCHRIWLAGYRVLYMPKSFIYHVAGGDTLTTYDHAKRIYLTFKNMNSSYLQNFGTFFLWTVYPVFVFVQISVFVLLLCIGKFGEAGAALRAWSWNATHFSMIMRQRNKVQSAIRKVSDRELQRHITYNPGLHFYVSSFLNFFAHQYVDAFIDRP